MCGSIDVAFVNALLAYAVSNPKEVESILGPNVDVLDTHPLSLERLGEEEMADDRRRTCLSRSGCSLYRQGRCNGISSSFCRRDFED